MLIQPIHPVTDKLEILDTLDRIYILSVVEECALNPTKSLCIPNIILKKYGYNGLFANNDLYNHEIEYNNTEEIININELDQLIIGESYINESRINSIKGRGLKLEQNNTIRCIKSSSNLNGTHTITW